MWNTAVNFNSWSALTAHNKARDAEEGKWRRGKMVTKGGGKQTHLPKRSLQRQSSTWPKTPCKVKPITVREAIKAKWALGTLTVHQGVQVSYILHAGVCLKSLLLLCAWAALLSILPCFLTLSLNHIKSISYHFSFSNKFLISIICNVTHLIHSLHSLLISFSWMRIIRKTQNFAWKQKLEKERK